MPTFERTESFKNDYRALSADERITFKQSLRDFIDDLTAIEVGTQSDFRNGLRVKSMRHRPGVHEMTWEISDGRATFHYGPEKLAGKRHVVWRRIGGHSIFGKP